MQAENGLCIQSLDYRFFTKCDLALILNFLISVDGNDFEQLLLSCYLLPIIKSRFIRKGALEHFVLEVLVDQNQRIDFFLMINRKIIFCMVD